MNLENVKAGEEVALIRSVMGPGENSVFIMPVDRVTKTQITVNRTIFRMRDGRETGDGWFKDHIEYPVTDTHRARAKAQQDERQRQKIATWISGQVKDASMEALLKIAKILEG